MITYNIDSYSDGVLKGWACCLDPSLLSISAWIVVPRSSARVKLPPPCRASGDVEELIAANLDLDDHSRHHFRRSRFIYDIRRFMPLDSQGFFFVKFQAESNRYSANTPLLRLPNSPQSGQKHIIILDHAVKAAGTSFVPKLLSSESLSVSCYYPGESTANAFSLESGFVLPRDQAHLHVGHLGHSHFIEFSKAIKDINCESNLTLLKGSLIRDPFDLLLSRIKWAFKHLDPNITFFDNLIVPELGLIDSGLFDMPGSVFVFEGLLQLSQFVELEESCYDLMGVVDFYVDVEHKTIHCRNSEVHELISPVLQDPIAECTTIENRSDPRISRQELLALRSKMAGELLEIYARQYKFIRQNWISIQL